MNKAKRQEKKKGNKTCTEKKCIEKNWKKNTVIIYITGKILHPFKRHSVYKKGYSRA